MLVHGFGLDGILTWKFQVLALSKEYAVRARLGESITDKKEAFQAECTAKGLRKLGVEKCALVGLCYGGIVCFKTAEMFPDLVESIVVS